MIQSHYVEGLGIYQILIVLALALGCAVGYAIGIWRERLSWTSDMSKAAVEIEKALRGSFGSGVMVKVGRTREEVDGPPDVHGVPEVRA